MTTGPTRLGVCVGVLGDDLTAETLRDLTASGIEVEIGAKTIDQRGPSLKDPILSGVDDGSIKISNLHIGGVDISAPDETSRTQAVDSALKQLDLAARLRAERVILHPSQSFPPTEDRTRRIRQCRKSLHEITQIAQEKKIKVCIEYLPHQKTGNDRVFLGNSSTELLELIDGFDDQILGVCLDTTHAYVIEDLVEIVRRLGRRLIALHVSDNDGRGRSHIWPFEGVIDWKALREALVEVDYAGIFMYEAVGVPTDPRELANKVRDTFERMQ